ncbi:MAG: hypothetical protein L7S72_07325 [Flavobacteriales bacterium]|nr:hypothetical protein [Flavobacteriales bacterium]
MNELIYSSKKRVEKVIFSNGKSIELLEDYNDNDGGVVVGIYDNKSVKKDYTDMGFTEKEMMFENDNEEEVGIDEVFCKLDLKDSSGGYSVFYDKDMNELLEL